MVFSTTELITESYFVPRKCFNKYLCSVLRTVRDSYGTKRPLKGPCLAEGSMIKDGLLQDLYKLNYNDKAELYFLHMQRAPFENPILYCEMWELNVIHYLSYYFSKTQIVSTRLNRLNETFPQFMFGSKLRKISGLFIP